MVLIAELTIIALVQVISPTEGQEDEITQGGSFKTISLRSVSRPWHDRKSSNEKEMPQQGQHCRLNICMELIELTNSETVSDDKIQITILILRCLVYPSQQSRVVPLVIQVLTHGLGASNIIPFFINSSLQLLFTSFLGGKLSRSMSLALAACFVSRWQKNCSCILRRCY